MAEFFIHGETFAAPFVPEPFDRYMEAETPEEALTKLAAQYAGQVGWHVYAMGCWASADDYHKEQAPRAKWLCNKGIAVVAATKGIEGAYSMYSSGPGSFEVDGKKYVVKDPFVGKIVEVE